jgi:hypothetical protein
MPRGREPEGEAALSNAERQARYRVRRQAPRPPLTIKQSRPANSPGRRGEAARSAGTTRWPRCSRSRPNAPRGSRPCPKACATAPRRRRFRRSSILIWTRSPRFSRRSAMAVTERHATTHGQSVAPRTVGGKSWVLAMLAPKAGAARGSGPAASGGFDTDRAWPPERCQVGTKEQVS